MRIDPTPMPSDRLRKTRHDVRNRLNAIMLTTEVLCAILEDDPETIGFLDGLIQAAEDLSRLMEVYPFEEAERLNSGIR